MLASSGAAIRAGLAGLPDEIAVWRPAAGEWCVNECLGHIIEAERRGFAGRIRLILETPGRAVEDWNQVEVQKARADDGKPLEDLLAEFATVRSDSVLLVEGLQPSDLPKSCEHPFAGTLTIGGLLHEWIHHDQNHYRQAQANIQAYLWPSMGGSQRFSQPH